MDPKAIITSEWTILKSSKTVRALLAVQALAVGTFVQGVLAGTQPLTVGSLEAWAAFQAAVVVAFFLRHALAGLEAKVHNSWVSGFLDDETVKKVEQGARDAALAILRARGHDAAASTLQQAFDADARQGG